MQPTTRRDCFGITAEPSGTARISYRDNPHQISIALLCNLEFTNVTATDDMVFAVSKVVQGKPFPEASAGRTSRSPRRERPRAKTTEDLKKVLRKIFQQRDRSPSSKLRDETALSS